MNEASERDKAIYADFLAGVDGATIGRKLGISRERVRQIIHNAGLKPKREQQRARREKVAKSIRDGMTAREAAKAHDESVQYVHSVAYAYGLTVPRLSKSMMATIDEIIDLALAGKASVFSLTRENRYLRDKVYRTIDERGLVLPHYKSRERARKQTVRRIIADG